MAKKLGRQLKVQIPGGSATPAPPLGPTLGQAGINISDFVNKFNDATQDRRGEIVPAVINVYEDKSFDFVLKKAPASDMLKKASGIKKGSGKNAVSRAGTVTKAQVREIAENKMEDLNANDIEAAMKIIEGSARSMGIEVK
jgi:large subunit ribosomal protein L11